MGMGPEWLLGGLLGMVLTLVIVGALAGVRRARSQAPAAVTVPADFLTHRIADGSCEWVPRHLADSRRMHDAYGFYPHPVSGTPCQRIGPQGVMEVLMIRPGTTAAHLPGPSGETVFQELMAHARTGSALRFTMLTVYLTATAALLTGFGSSEAEARRLIAAGGLALTAVFLTLEVVLSFNLAALNETARRLARPRHGDIMTHRRALPLWTVRIVLVMLFVAIAGFWAQALIHYMPA